MMTAPTDMADTSQIVAAVLQRKRTSMVLRFLRLFQAFRALEGDRDVTVASLCETVQQMTTEKLLLQDRLDSLMNDRAELWRMMEKAIENERATLQMQVNFSAQQKFGVIPFPEATHLPASMEAGDARAPIPGYRTPSQRIQARTNKFAQSFAQKLAAVVPQ